MRDFNKIFCIGMNKTGTTSLHHAFIDLGIPSLHGSPDGLRPVWVMPVFAKRMTEYLNERLSRGVQNPLGVFDVFRAYLDLYSFITFFRELDEAYPNSLFVYTNRNDEEWIASRENHLSELNKSAESRQKWLKEKHDHESKVFRYFKDRPDDLLCIDICDGEGFEKLCPFLGLPVPDKAFPVKNKKRK